MKSRLENDVKIMSLEGSDILKNNLQEQVIDKNYNVTFSQSLLLNKLIELGLNVKNSTTRDIINVKFSYGFDVDAEEIAGLEKKVEELKQINKDSVAADKNYGVTIVKNRRLERKKNSDIIKQLKKEIAKLKLSKDEVRELLYEDGFFLDFYKVAKDENKRIVRDVNGKKVYELDERIQYLRWFRTSSKAIIGECFFINVKLLGEITKWQQIGVEFAENEDCKLVEMEAYKALTASSLEGLMKINTRTDILVIDDLESHSKHKCKLVKVDENENCYVEDDDNHELKNVLFDGQSLISSELMEENDLTKGRAGVLLRGHMFKSFALNTNIELFMRDIYQDDYDTAYIRDRYGRDIKVSDIKLITTNNSMKWEKKFDITMEDWIEATEQDGNLFGIVKTEKESKYDNLQRMSYQMLNTLDPKKVSMDNVLKDTLEFTDNIQNDIDHYIEYLDTTKNDTNINQMLLDLYSKNKNIVGTDLFRDYKKYQIRSWKDNLKSGKALINGDNLTIIGSPYTMLSHAVGQVKHVGNVIDDKYIDSSLGQGNTCYTTRFDDEEELALFRSPHNSPNNIGYSVNVKSDLIDKYFNLTDNIILVNLISIDFQDRLNGSDQDSDFVLTTNQSDIVNFARECQDKYPTIVNEIPENSRDYENNSKAIAEIDNTLAKGKNDIGITSNLAQVALSWYMHNKNEELSDVVCISSVLAQVAIDSAKRAYSVKLRDQIRNINKLECMQVNVEYEEADKKTGEIRTKIGLAKPSFWKYTSDSFKKKDEGKLKKVDCFMCLLEDKINSISDSKRIENIDIVSLLDSDISNKYKYEQVQSLIDKYKEYKNKDLFIANQISNTKSEKRKVKLRDEQSRNLANINKEVAKLKINNRNMKAYIKKYTERKSGLHSDFLGLLYDNHKDIFLGVFLEDEKGVNKYKKSA